jgi:hypothetical protein
MKAVGGPTAAWLFACTFLLPFLFILLSLIFMSFFPELVRKKLPG